MTNSLSVKGNILHTELLMDMSILCSALAWNNFMVSSFSVYVMMGPTQNVAGKDSILRKSCDGWPWSRFSMGLVMTRIMGLFHVLLELTMFSVKYHQYLFPSVHPSSCNVKYSISFFSFFPSDSYHKSSFI